MDDCYTFSHNYYEYVELEHVMQYEYCPSFVLYQEFVFLSSHGNIPKEGVSPGQIILTPNGPVHTHTPYLHEQ